MKHLVDVTLHIDEALDSARREAVTDGIREASGVVAVAAQEGTPHLLIVEYDPEQTDAKQILQRVHDEGVHAELIGL